MSALNIHETTQPPLPFSKQPKQKQLVVVFFLLILAAASRWSCPNVKSHHITDQATACHPVLSRCVSCLFCRQERAATNERPWELSYQRTRKTRSSIVYGAFSSAGLLHPSNPVGSVHLNEWCGCSRDGPLMQACGRAISQLKLSPNQLKTQGKPSQLKPNQTQAHANLHDRL